MLNGDFLWNNVLKKQQKGAPLPKKAKNAVAKKGARLGSKKGNFMINIMDIRQLLLYTKDRLDFYSSQHSELNLQLPSNNKLDGADYKIQLNEEMYADRNEDDLYNMQPREGSYD